MYDNIRDYLIDLVIFDDADLRGEPLKEPKKGGKRSMRAFKEGDRVRLKSTVDMQDVYGYSSTGMLGKVYTIERLHPIMEEVFLKGSNWHKNKWLEHVPCKTKVGGKLLC